ncbi:hypothetical protein PIB30_058321 [Stylosanthes scabra]|uniref:Bet v I/Major latex protein domain-containing protein n=1 Tax=Stylosanthes scabra TaxID=79078 RepID=A0ABU6UKG1_9FABA|nr:hypothetical protein [Stylosanthes scabra]
MALSGKISIEVMIQSPAAKFFNVFTNQVYNFQNICERVHQGKLHEGDDWHSTDSAKQWTLLIDGKIITLKENIEGVDEENKSITYNFFDGDISPQYKAFKVFFQVIENEKNDNGIASTKFSIEYEKNNENVETPYGFLEFFDKAIKEVDVHLLNNAA